jgi:hypothetical protein
MGFFCAILAPPAVQRGSAPGAAQTPALRPARPLQDNLERLISIPAAGVRSMMQCS